MPIVNVQIHRADQPPKNSLIDHHRQFYREGFFYLCDMRLVYIPSARTQYHRLSVLQAASQGCMRICEGPWVCVLTTGSVMRSAFNLTNTLKNRYINYAETLLANFTPYPGHLQYPFLHSQRHPSSGCSNDVSGNR